MRAITLVLGIAVAATATGCVGYVDAGYGGSVVVPLPPIPDVVVFGGGIEHERGPEVHEFSRRGHESREAAHHDEHGRGDRH